MLIHGEKLEAVRELLHFLAQQDNPETLYTPTLVRGSSWRDKNYRLRMRIGTWDTPAGEVERKMRFYAQFGKPTLFRDKSKDNAIYADLTEVDIDKMAPQFDIRAMDRTRRVTDEIIHSLEAVQQTLAQRLPVAGDPVLEADVKTYEREHGPRDPLRVMEQLKMVHGAAPDEMDLFSAMMLHLWVQGGSSRDAQLYNTIGYEMLPSFIQDFKALRASLDNTPASPPADSAAAGRSRTFGSGLFSLFPSLCVGPLCCVLSCPRQPWLHADKAEEAKQTLEHSLDLVREHQDTLIPALHLSLYKDAVAAVTRSQAK